MNRSAILSNIWARPKGLWSGVVKAPREDFGTFAIHPIADVCASIRIYAKWPDEESSGLRLGLWKYPAGRAHDREMIRQLNLEESAKVCQRDARRAQLWHAAHLASSEAANEYAARFQDYQRAMANYARSRVRFARQMDDWRRAVDACRAGDYSACDN
ncbi:hypothetical protein [Aquisediminimonas profunda]|uniref:hypothetical protein n=1 Tax=Aquisediminimonas profunda TaxID=1550733 RepID=UPI001C629A0D|nr:hypothetical protein [Aquisediminimonas profunda]